MDSRDKKPSKPSTSRPGGIRTLSDLNRPPPGAESDSDSDAPQEYYTGGEKRYRFLLLLLHKISMKHVWSPPLLDHAGIGSGLVQLEWYGPLDWWRARSNLSRDQSNGIGQLVPCDVKGLMVQGWAPQWLKKLGFFFFSFWAFMDSFLRVACNFEPACLSLDHGKRLELNSTWQLLIG